MLQQAKNSKQLLPKKKAFGIVCKIITFVMENPCKADLDKITININL